jgi:hypothetical protein
MLIHEHNPHYIFVAVPKTGTTSINNFLKYQHVMPFLTSKKCKWLSRDYHLSIMEILRNYHTHIGYGTDPRSNSALIRTASKFYKFAFHRNPWDRMVSFYTDYTTGPLHLKSWSSPLLKYKTFKEFVMDFNQSEWRHHKNFKPTNEYTHHGGVQIVDHIYRYNNYEQEVFDLCEKLKLNFALFRQGGINRKAPREINYREYYSHDQPMIDAVAEAFKEDIEIFGDTFD